MVTIRNVPASYDGREQAWTKHLLLETYLQRLLLIVGMGHRKAGEVELCYVDCFAGPWGDESDDLEGTSIAISLRTMEECRRVLKGQGVNVKMRALYIERDDVAFVRLRTYLQQSSPEGIAAMCMHGDFVDLRDDILNWCGRQAFTFFFIDPKGWKSVAVPLLQPLLARPYSEFLINFMYDFINRTASMPAWKQEIAYFLGCDAETVDRLDGQAPGQREESLLRTYRESLKLAFKNRQPNQSARTAHVRVMDPVRRRPKYHLVYLTSHPKGIVEFMEISEKLDLVQRRVSASKRNARREASSGTSDLFGTDSFEAVTPASAEVQPHEIDGFWLQYLTDGPKRIGETEMAGLFEDTGWMPGDFQASLVRLIQDGDVRNLDAIKARRSRPLHYERQGERLMLVPRDEAQIR